MPKLGEPKKLGELEKLCPTTGKMDDRTVDRGFKRIPTCG
jgi:hypothetical protein